MQVTTIQQILTKGQEVAQARPMAISPEALEGIRSGTIVAQQGDIYIAKLSKLPAQATQDLAATGQLAPGTSQGSRHCVDATHVRLWLLPSPTALQGPIVEAPDGCTIVHPEHAWITLPPGIYQITYQRAYADELRRVAD